MRIMEYVYDDIGVYIRVYWSINRRVLEYKYESIGV